MPQALAPREPEPPVLVAPATFYDALESMVGQDVLRLKLASTFYQYLLYLREPQAGRPNLIVYGRSGSGKTYGVRLCIEAAGLPFTVASAAGIAPPGFRGRVLIDVLIDHWRRWKTDQGVIFLDEIDKLCAGSRTQDGKAVRTQSEMEQGGVALQQELLTYLEREVVTFTDEAKDVEELEGVAFDTSRTFFILAGAFVGLDRIVRSRLHNSFMQEDDAWKNAIPQDFRAYGMSAEFADRISTWAWTTPLTVSRMMDILRDQDIPRWRHRFEAVDCHLQIDDGALGACATHAWEMKEGPRVAKAMLARSLDEVLTLASQHRLKTLDWDGVVVVDSGVIRSGQPSF